MLQLARKRAPKTQTSHKPRVEYIDLGRLSHETWPGGVSADAMIKAGLFTAESIKDAIKSLSDYYVQVNPNAKTRCIDGRHDPQIDESNLGPQVPGGAPGAALAYRLGVDKDDLTRGTFVSDAEAMIDQFKRLGLSPGGHKDATHGNDASSPFVGCGAIDAMDRVLATMTDRSLVDDHKRVVKQLLGSRFDRDNYLRVMGASVVVNARGEDYFSRREAIIDILESRFHGSIATLEGTHQECLWVINMVPGTTLATDRFATSHDGMQAFGYDLWWSLQMASLILPRPDQAVDRDRFVMARVMSTVATIMSLTDGSQRVVLRIPA